MSSIPKCVYSRAPVNLPQWIYLGIEYLEDLTLQLLGVLLIDIKL